jgi:hypothetical protein
VTRAAVLERFGEPLAEVEVEVELAGLAPDLRGQLKLDELISEVIGLSEATRGLEQLDRSDGARSVISFGGGRG